MWEEEGSIVITRSLRLAASAADSARVAPRFSRSERRRAHVVGDDPEPLLDEVAEHPARPFVPVPDESHVPC